MTFFVTVFFFKVPHTTANCKLCIVEDVFGFVLLYQSSVRWRFISKQTQKPELPTSNNFLRLNQQVDNYATNELLSWSGTL